MIGIVIGVVVLIIVFGIIIFGLVSIGVIEDFIDAIEDAAERIEEHKKWKAKRREEKEK